MLEHGGIHPTGWLSYRWPFPSDSIVAGCYCDDYGQIALGADDLDSDDFVGAEEFATQSILSQARSRIKGVHKGYQESCLIRKEVKARSEEKDMTLWGALVSGEHKTVRGSLDKMKLLLSLTTQLLGAPTSSSDEVAALLGHWTFHCMFRRSCLCLLNEAYAWVRRDATGSKRRTLSTRVRDEFLGLLLLWPLLQADMQAVPAERLYASDTTVDRGAV
eukprot:1452051-Amphidinium_carterae.1